VSSNFILSQVQFMPLTPTLVDHCSEMYVKSLTNVHVNVRTL